MTLKEVEEVISVLDKFKVDTNNNWRSEVNQAILILQKEKILRLRQRKNMKDNFEPSDLRY